MPHPSLIAANPLAKNVLIDGNSVALIWTDFANSYSLAGFEMTSGAETQFMSSSSDVFTLIYDDSTDIDGYSILDVARLWDVNINATNVDTLVTLGDVLFGRLLNFKNGNVHIYGALQLHNDVAGYDWHTSYVWFKETASITMHKGSSITASYIQLQSNGAIRTEPGTNITSMLTSSCNMEKENSNLFTCVP